MQVTTRDIEQLATKINKIKGKSIDRKTNNIINVGHYFISRAYYGFSFYQITNKGGACVDVFESGHITKRELYQLMLVFEQGITS